jgi:sugar lactone lactonase YvrE
VVGIASNGEDLWVARDGNVVAKVDGVTGAEVAAFRLADRELFGPRDAGFIGVGGGSLWLAVPGRPGHPEELWRIDPGNGDVLAAIPIGGEANPPFAHDGYVWVVTKEDQGLTRIDMRTNEALEVDVGSYPWSLTAGGGALWIGHHVSPRVMRLGPDTLEESVELEFDTNPRGLAFGGGRIWVASEAGLHPIDPASNEVIRIVEFGPFPSDTGPIGVGFLDGSVWISIE